MSVNNVEQHQFQSREEYKKAKTDALQQVDDAAAKERKTAEAEPKNHARIRVRLIPIWLRLVLLVVLLFVSLVAGAAVGYGILGGGNAADVFKQSTWTHIQDLIDKK
ncbi:MULTISPECIES: DNA-directed RNA polymerase subunit beta [Neobacillus]|uniref:DNA-directed RNA polymerase subunit beta n=1 Tax=Neobacillus rhizophilus TaxID=2833579 RepID=A0A942YT80_9BACI|nr:MULTISPECIES: DNA-directed RNA polymerase subunit beta [Neobacillus]MBS4212653.1 DNA-directed RNA polymerase subunit beta [Neobacillus rhizophilus]